MPIATTTVYRFYFSHHGLGLKLISKRPLTRKELIKAAWWAKGVYLAQYTYFRDNTAESYDLTVDISNYASTRDYNFATYDWESIKVEYKAMANLCFSTQVFRNGFSPQNYSLKYNCLPQNQKIRFDPNCLIAPSP